MIGEFWDLADIKALFHFEGNSNDDSGSGNGGSDTAITYGLTHGKFRQGASFNGSTSVISIGATGFPSGTNAGTFLAWIYPTTFNDSAAIFGYGTASANQARIFGFGAGTDNNKLQFGAYANNAPIDPTAIAQNAWTMVGYNVSGTTVKYYVNGHLSSSTTISSMNTTLGGYSYLGQGYSGGQKYTGKIDEALYFASSLSDNLIRKWYAWSKGRFL